MRDIGKASRRPHRFARCRFARATGTAASPSLVGGGFRAASRMARDAPHRHATRSWPKASGSRLYESLSALLGTSAHETTARPQSSGDGRCLFTAWTLSGYRGWSNWPRWDPAVGQMLIVSIGIRIGVGVRVVVCTVLIDTHALARPINGNRGRIRRRISAILDDG